MAILEDWRWPDGLYRDARQTGGNVQDQGYSAAIAGAIFPWLLFVHDRFRAGRDNQRLDQHEPGYLGSKTPTGWDQALQHQRRTSAVGGVGRCGRRPLKE
ncbi:protein of unknown function (plasmid) [Cupriavidus taiwanensis]|nr:protein of unknown function [Cupriavidus taiwanensis]